jgi:hypothetical protein
MIHELKTDLTFLLSHSQRGEIITELIEQPHFGQQPIQALHKR